jgi:hypothetical protein
MIVAPQVVVPSMLQFHLRLILSFNAYKILVGQNAYDSAISGQREYDPTISQVKERTYTNTSIKCPTREIPYGALAVGTLLFNDVPIQTWRLHIYSVG